ncbi:radical SAM family heme chaperone HemW [Enterobacteriaceae endosymbiont of Plateumaris braccata]|uniref:radical SAM family heme chaperone HemW n=1 Tax=Enterobacteriaceae endosymbiont of Plateumaris braccata TaxID=2675793 RepID=UPI001449436B|nr:radical SAM family heme chaperone HemW [Enterobacteriaceae endosymbiont of Plateumaris braccata]QJC28243.1 radical SAM family heme chaperone HemW [Enterobacteriaceae endosymbiont of Plateumaris braccata]
MKKKYYSLYIHIPWCLKKCPYCDFYSLIISNNNSSENIKKKYINNLLFDLENDLFFLKEKYIYIKSIFFGGGTPSLINGKLIDYLLNEINKKVYIKKSAEITIETNPSSINKKNILEYKKSGINRVSIGVQSFHDISLKLLGRIHSAQDAINSINTVIDNGFINFNIDLMYGIPGQSLKEAKNDLYQTLLFNPKHISWYQLTIEPNTIFNKYKPINLPKFNTLWKIFKEGKKILKEYGYINYEISSFVKEDIFKCKHNLNYWNFGDYIGIGCSAHGKFTMNDGSIIRTIKNNNIIKYMDGNYLFTHKKVKDCDKILEFFLNRFRLFEKISKKDFTLTTGIKINSINSNIEKSIKLGYMKHNKNYLIITKKGYLFLNNLLEIFI